MFSTWLIAVAIILLLLQILTSSIIRCQSTVESGVLHIFLLKLKLTLTKSTAPTQTGSRVPSSALTIATPTKSTAATESGTTGSEVYIL